MNQNQNQIDTDHRALPSRCCFFLAAYLILSFFSAFAGQLFAQPPITALAFSPDGTQILVGSQSGVRIFDVDRNSVGEIKTELEFINDLQFETSGRKLAIVGGSPSESGSVEVFNWPQRERLIQKEISDDVVYSVAWSPDGQKMVMAGHDTVCRLFDLGSKQTTKKWTEHSRPVTAIRFLAESNSLVSSSFDQTIRVWHTERETALRSLNNHTAEVNTISVSPIRSPSKLQMLVSVGQDKTVRFWQPMIGRMVRFARLSSTPLCVQWDVDGRYVVVGCEDGKALIVDSQTVAVVSEVQLFDGPIFCLDRHPGQNLFALGGSNSRWQLLAPEPFKKASDQ